MDGSKLILKVSVIELGAMGTDFLRLWELNYWAFRLLGVSRVAGSPYYDTEGYMGLISTILLDKYFRPHYILIIPFKLNIN